MEKKRDQFQLGRSYDAECGSSSESDAQSLQSQSHHQHQQQQQQREQFRECERERERERDREREREHLHQLQSISSLLLDLPPASSGPYTSGYGRDGSCVQTPRGSITDGKSQILIRTCAIVIYSSFLISRFRLRKYVYVASSEEEGV